MKTKTLKAIQHPTVDVGDIWQTWTRLFYFLVQVCVS